MTAAACRRQLTAGGGWSCSLSFRCWPDARFRQGRQPLRRSTRIWTNGGNQNGQGYRLKKFHTAKLRRGCSDFARDKSSAGW